MIYELLAKLYENLSSTTKRLEKIKILSEFLETLPQKNSDAMYLLLGDIYPEYDERRIGISNQLAIKSIANSTGNTIKTITSEWKKMGDLGLVAEKLTTHKKQFTLESKTLTIEQVIEDLRKLPELIGTGTVNKKLAIITGLLTSATPSEAKYLTRTLIGDLRIGVKESSIRESLAKAFFPKTENASKQIQKAIDRTNDIASVFIVCKTKKLKDLEKLHLQVGKPIKAMLAQKTKSVEDGFKALGKPCAVEYKYDGFRLIIHKIGDQVTLFTRSLENVTKQFPEVKDFILKYVKGESFILDSEAVGFNKKTKKYTDFQAISQRIRRKHKINELQNKLPIEINVFDILYYNGKSYLSEPFEKRTKLIRQIITNHPFKIIHSKQIITSNEKRAKEFYKKALHDNQEGVMMKNLKAEYNPGSRVGHMLKIKPDERDLDLVITGAEYGTGKRSGWMSSFILSCRGNKKDEYLEIGKVGTGISEKEGDKITFDQLTKKLTPLIISEKGKSVKLKPKLIVSVTYQEIQKSPNYNSGWALRFPRFTTLRNDKPLSEIADLKEIIEDFKHQKRNYRYG